MEAEGLNERQELFCQFYVSREFFGNGVQTYIEVYKPDQTKPNWYASACSSASQILSNIKVSERINTLLDAAGLNDSFVDKQLLFLLTQHSDFGSKIAAIREYNKLKQRIIDQTVTKSTVDFDLSNLTTDELRVVEKLIGKQGKG